MPEQNQSLDEGQRSFVISMLQKMPETLSQMMLSDATVRADLGVPAEESILVFDQRFDRASLFKALRDVANSRPVALNSVNGSLSIQNALLKEDGSAVFVAGDQRARFANTGLLSDDPEIRERAFEAILRYEDLSAEMETRLSTWVKSGPIEEEQFVELEEFIETTPKAVYRRLDAEAGESLTFDALIPEERRFFEELLGTSPPDTLCAYRSGWLTLAAALDPIRRARLIALTAPIAVLRGNLVATAAKDLNRDVRLRLTRFLTGSPDPLSQVAGFELAAAEYIDPAFRALGDEILPRLLDPVHQHTGPALSFLAASLILTGTVSTRRRTLDCWPIYAKRLVWHIHASLLVRTFGNGRVDAEDMQRVVGRPLAQNYRLVELCEARNAPINQWSAPTVERIHAAMISKVIQTLADIPEDERPPAWTKAVDSTVEQITSGPHALTYMAAGPFDPFDEGWGGLIQLPQESIDETLMRLESKGDPQRTLSDLFNLVVAFEIEDNNRDTLAKEIPEFLKSLPDETFSAGADLALQLIARWKKPEVAEKIIDLSLVRAASGAINDVSVGPRFSLLGSASLADGEEWARKTGEYMAGFAFALPAGTATRNILAAIELICDFAPSLRTPLVPAKSFAMLAHDGFTT